VTATNEAEVLLKQIDDACRRMGMAQTTFGRQAVNDGKLVARLQQGGRVTISTVDRVHRFIEQGGGDSAISLRSAIMGLHTEMRPEQHFRFYDNRQKYLMFVNTTSEKHIIADRAVQEVMKSQPRPPAIRLFDGGAGDGTALARILRGMHRLQPWVPFYAVAKEISKENVRLTLEKMPDRLQEHPATVLVLTNLTYAKAPLLQPATPAAASSMIWHELVLDGTTAGDFEEQITGLDEFLARHWGASISSASGNPIYKTPVVLVIYRRDHRFLLDPIVPRRGYASADFDFILLSQPYPARAPLSFKTSRIVTPLVRALRPNGRLMGVHSHGNDPGIELIRKIWPDENPFTTSGKDIIDGVTAELGREARDYQFDHLTDAESLFRYDVRTLPTEIDGSAEIGSSTLFAAWNAASYVGQIDDRRLAQALTNNRYLEATRDTLRQHRGLWFNDEVYIISRRAELG